MVSVSIPEGVTCIDERAFEGCYNLEEISLPESLKEINTYAFWDCIKLKSVSLPSNLEVIGNDAFRTCNSLTDVTIPKSVVSIGVGAFACENLENISVDAANTSFKSLDGVLFTKDLKTLKIYPMGKENTSYMVQNGVEKIEDNAFEGCDNLIDIVLSETVQYIGNDVFVDCNILESFMIDRDNEYFKSIDDVLYSYDGSVIYKYPCMKEEVEYDIPQGVTTIREYAFQGCINLTDVDIPSSVSEFGYKSFSECSSLEKVVIPNTVNNIPDYTFERCISLSEVKIPDSVGEIGIGAFINCDSLVSVVIPYGVTSMEKYCFGNCDNLEEIYIPASVTTMGYICDGSLNLSKIYGVKGSRAEEYAELMGITFVEYTNELEVTLDSDVTNITVGENVILTANATGGTGLYTYSFLINNPDTNEWYRYGNGTFKTGNTHTWKVAGSGKRKFFVEVKDGAETVVRSKAAVVVIKE